MFIDRLNDSKKKNQQAVVVCSRRANIKKEELQAAFGKSVRVIYTDEPVMNGVEYIGSAT